MKLPELNKFRGKRCARCALPSTFPGVKFDRNGVCNYCAFFELNREREAAVKAKLRKEFITLINEIKKKKNRYDCIVAYSGGKDSTFLLQFLKTRFNLKILAHVFDNGFVSPLAQKNIREVTSRLKIDLKITRPDFKLLKGIFQYALREKNLYPREMMSMLSPVCAACLGIVFGTTIYAAVKAKIPLMFVGFTPGQYPAISLENFFKVRSCVFISDKVYRDDPQDILKIIADPLREKFGSGINRYFFKSQYPERAAAVPKILFPFHMFVEYDEEKIIEEISRLGWERPKDTDSCSTNCLLNTLASFSCMNRYGYHPYIGELSYLVRCGKITRQQALKTERMKSNLPTMKHCLEKLGLEAL